MFEKYEKINSLNLFDFHTLAAIYMNNAFNECWNLSSLNMKNFNIIYVVDIQYIFYQCEKFN